MSDDTTAPHTAAAADPVPHAVFHLNDVAPQERYDLWRDSISCIFDVEAQRETRQGDFRAEIDANMFGPVMLARTQTLQQRWCRSTRTIARDGMDHYMVQLYERGRMQWDNGGSTELFPRKGLVVFDLSRPISLETDSFTNISLIIPRAMLEETLDQPHDQHMRVLTAEEPMVALLRDHMASLKRLSDRMTARQAMELAPATVGLAAACLNAALDHRLDTHPGQRQGVERAHLIRIRRLIEQEVSNPALSPDWIARMAGVSRSRLFAMFEPYGGVAAYIRDRRLWLALRQLSSKDRRVSVADAADLAGYASVAAFGRAFKRRYGVLPKDVRHAGAPPGYLDLGDARVDRRYERWLNQLTL